MLLVCWTKRSLAQQTQKVYLTGTDKDHTVPWNFFCSKGQNSGKWTKIQVPSNWELQGFGQYSYGIQNRQDSTKANETGRYRHAFHAPKAWKTGRVFIVFEGSMTDTEVKINGQLVGKPHQGGFTQFQYEITSFIQTGRNQLEVTVHKESANRSVDVAERHGDFWAFGGLYRPVYLEIVPSRFIERVAIDAKADGRLAVDVFTANAAAEQEVQAQVQTLTGQNVGPAFKAAINPANPKTTLTQVLPNVKRWNAETPNLYQVVVSLTDKLRVVHTRTQRFGFRTIEVRQSDGVYVNGQKIMLRGCNRHTFVPETGRTTSKAVSVQDVKLMQEMNMNAVRMSHYPPDSHFLDVCDSLGMYVLDELTGWQNKYDTLVGRKLVGELVSRDVNHPSILFWDNGNEGGWNRALDGDYALHDPQQRVVLHPWERFNGFDTKHYLSYAYLVNSALYDPDILMPTEFMHGLFDGGHGAGLDDFWDLMLKHPHCSGGFLWSFMDEGVVRIDRSRTNQSRPASVRQPNIIDVFGNYAPDGILGPHYEKEASFYTIKEIWSPVRITKTKLTSTFDGKLEVENHYSFTDLRQCKFTWQLVSFPEPTTKFQQAIVEQSGQLLPVAIAAGETGYINLNLPTTWRNSDALYLTATDPGGKELFTWSWKIPVVKEASPKQQLAAPSSAAVVVRETDTLLTLQAGKLTYTFNKTTGYLAAVKTAKTTFSLSQGPMLAGVRLSLKALQHHARENGYELDISYEGDNGTLNAHWRLAADQPAELTYQYTQRGDADFMGITFAYPEAKVTGMKWLGRGPYRVWKNRLKGMKYGVWHKDFNKAVTGEDFNYPEFEGYHSEVSWVVVETTEGNFTVEVVDEPVFLQMLQPGKPQAAANDNTSPAFPMATLGFLNSISAIGTKFQTASQLGPQSQKNSILNYTPIKGKLKFFF